MDDLVESIQSSLREQISFCKTLINLLIDEESKLRKNEFDQLNELSEKKSEVLKRIEEATERYSQLLSDFIEGEPSHEHLLQSNKLSSTQKAELEEQINSLKTLSEDCQRRNNINGRVILVNQYINQKLVNILKGVEGGSIYSAKGRLES